MIYLNNENYTNIMMSKKNRLDQLDPKKLADIRFNRAKHLFKLGYYKIIEIDAFEPEGRPIDFPFRFQATVKYKGGEGQEYPETPEQIRRINPLLNKIAKHNLLELKMGKPEKSLGYFQKIASSGEIKIIGIELVDGSYEIEWELIPFSY